MTDTVSNLSTGV